MVVVNDFHHPLVIGAANHDFCIEEPLVINGGLITMAEVTRWFSAQMRN